MQLLTLPPSRRRQCHRYAPAARRRCAPSVNVLRPVRRYANWANCVRHGATLRAEVPDCVTKKAILRALPGAGAGLRHRGRSSWCSAPWWRRASRRTSPTCTRFSPCSRRCSSCPPASWRRGSRPPSPHVDPGPRPGEVPGLPHLQGDLREAARRVGRALSRRSSAGRGRPGPAGTPRPAAPSWRSHGARAPAWCTLRRGVRGGARRP